MRWSAGRTLGCSALTTALLVAVAGVLPVQAASASSVSAVPAASAATVAVSTAAAPAGSETVSLILAPPNTAALAGLASAHNVSQSSRTVALASVVPSSAEHTDVAQALTGLGLTLTSNTPLVMKARGPASVINSLFATQAVRAGDPAAGHVITKIPSSLQGLVTAAVGANESQTFAHPVDLVRAGGASGASATSASTAASASSASSAASASSDASGVTVPRALAPADQSPPSCAPVNAIVPVSCGYTGADLRAAYGGPAIAAPVAGVTDTIATLELSGWNASDLTTFAQANGISLAAGQYQGISVDGASMTTPDGMGGQTEVDLDQEALLAVAPHADQLAFFAPNSGEGVVDALSELFSDNTIQEPAAHIAALTDSWGDCEIATFGGSASGSFSPADIQMADGFSELFSYLVASGITVFASSGDDGTNDDCSVGNTAVKVDSVDYPASDPAVIGVGGTTLLSNAAGVAEPAADQTAWSDQKAPDCTIDGSVYGGVIGGSGGGVSAVFDEPSYQAGLTDSTGMRMVPDISSMADPNCYAGDSFAVDDANGGFDSYSSNPGSGYPDWDQAGGTSLAAPTQAALLTDELLADGYSEGMGDIQSSLYAANGTQGITDITLPGYSGNVDGYVEPVAAGYDEATGLGTPDWSYLFPTLVGTPFIQLNTFFVNKRTVPLTMTYPQTAPSPYSKWSTAQAYAEPLSAAEPSLPTAAECTAAATSDSPPTSVTLPSANGFYNVYVFAVDTAGTCFTSFSQLFLDTVKPTVTNEQFIPVGGASAVMKVSWTGADAGSTSQSNPTGSGIASYHYELLHGSSVVVNGRSLATSFSAKVTAGATYTLSVTATDVAGNSSTTSITREAPRNDTQLTAGPGWVEHSGNAAEYADGARWASGKGDVLTLHFTGRIVTLFMTTSSASGEADILIDGRHTTTLNLYSAKTTYRVARVLLDNATAGAHTLQIKVAGVHVVASRGNTVMIDALAVR